MNVLHYFVKRLGEKFAAGLFVVLGLVACSEAEKPTNPDTQPAPEVTFSIDARGNLNFKDTDGKPLGTQCSTDPKDPNACPIFVEGHKIQVEQLSNVSIIRYHGSPQCYLVIFNGIAYVLPSASYCHK